MNKFLCDHQWANLTDEEDIDIIEVLKLMRNKKNGIKFKEFKTTTNDIEGFSGKEFAEWAQKNLKNMTLEDATEFGQELLDRGTFYSLKRETFFITYKEFIYAIKFDDKKIEDDTESSDSRESEYNIKILQALSGTRFFIFNEKYFDFGSSL